MSDMEDSDYYDSGSGEGMEATSSDAGSLMSEGDDDYGFDHGAELASAGRKVRV